MPDPELRIVAAGDVIPVWPLPPDAELTDPVRAVLHELRRADIAFGTLEAPLTDRGVAWEKVVSYRAEPSRATDLASMGFDVLSLANNQILNYGLDGLTQTIELLDAHGIRHVGAGADVESAWAPAITVADSGVTVAVTAFTCVAPGGWAATVDRGGVAALRVSTAYEIDARWEYEEPGIPPRVRTRVEEAELARAVHSITVAREQADVVLVAVHWGVGAQTARAEYQEQLGRALIDAGATVVLGSHPPPLQGVEVYGEGLISYSQGTFIRQQPVAPELAELYMRMPRAGCLLRLEVSDDAQVDVTVVPTMLDAHMVSGVADRLVAADILGQIIERSVDQGGRLKLDEGNLALTLRQLQCGTR